MGSALKWFKYETGAHCPEKVTGTAVWVATRQPPPKPRTVDMSLKAAEFNVMLAQHQAQTEELDTFGRRIASSSYKFGVTRIVMDMLKKSNIGLPEGWYNDAAKRGAVSSAVTKYLTWMWADMKKLLADAIVGLGGPNTFAMPLHRAHFAVMDKVDEKLKSICETANSWYPNDILKAKKKIHTALNDIVQVDFEMWGNPMDSGRFTSHEGASSSNLIQRAIDNIATARAGDLGDLSMHRKANGQAHRKRHRVS
ncbi:hypothetical protein EI94DRAFT_1704138 [Lactarius quietus]|nr:hypothetical protein EI94DRAFT_1704138 [Lactarius quietus]